MIDVGADGRERKQYAVIEKRVEEDQNKRCGEVDAVDMDKADAVDMDKDQSKRCDEVDAVDMDNADAVDMDKISEAMGFDREASSLMRTIAEVWPREGSTPPVTFNARYVREEGQKAVEAGYLEGDMLKEVLATFEIGADLGRRHELKGKRQVCNYPVEDPIWEHSMAKTIRKLLHTGKDIGPMRWSGDMHALPWEVVRINAKFAVPCKDDAKRARCIDGCSKPEGDALNDDQREMKYGLHVIRDLRRAMTRRSWIAMTDAEAAFPQVPLQLADMPLCLHTFCDVVNDSELLGTTNDALYAHRCGFFGPRNMPYRWMQTAWVLIGIAASQGWHNIYAHMDDFPMTADGEQACNDKLDAFSELMTAGCTGVLEKVEKRKRPFRMGLVLGLGFDMDRFKCYIQEEKLIELQQLLTQLLHCRYTTQLKAQQVLGKLIWNMQALPEYANVVMQPLFELLKKTKRREHKIRMRRRHYDAAVMTLDVLEQWGASRDINTHDRPWTQVLWTDASGGSKGGGGWFQAGKWHQWRHTRKQRKASIAWLEMYALYMAVVACGTQWKGCTVPLLIDNMTCAHILQKKRCKSKNLNELMSRIFAVALEYDFVFHVYWIPLANNKMADPLSRCDQAAFQVNLPSWKQLSRDTLASARMSRHLWAKDR